MKRRAFVSLLAGAAAFAAPFAVRAQQPAQVRRVGVLLPTAESDAEGQSRAAAIRQGLAQRGWTIGGNLLIDYRWVGGDMGRLRTHAAELVAAKPDVLVSSGTNPLAALYRETRTIPIVFVQAIDPVGGGYVASLAHPGGNVTGFANFEYGIAGKWLELLKQIAPAVTRVAVVHERSSPQAGALMREIEAGAPAIGVNVVALPMQERADLDRAVETFAREPTGGMIVLSSPFTVGHRDVLIGLAAQHRLPSVYPFRYFAQGGGLAAYGIDNHDLYKRAMSYVDRILKGEQAADLPVQQATKFELAINLKTAKALGLEVPATLLALADEVIE